MANLQKDCLGHVSLTKETVQSFYDGTRSKGRDEECLKALCKSHERLRAELEGTEVMLGMHCSDWMKRLREFAEDQEQHDIDFDQWQEDHGHGVTLYSSGDFFTAYFDDAGEMWSQADDSLPMFHVGSGRPYRTCIHALHLALWAQHLASVCMPLQIMGRDE